MEDTGNSLRVRAWREVSAGLPTWNWSGMVARGGADRCDDVAFLVDGDNLILGVSDGAGAQGGAAARLVADRLVAAGDRLAVGALRDLSAAISALDDEITALSELTRGQPRRRLGDGIGALHAIGPLRLAGPVIVTSDGLWRRVGAEAAFAIVERAALHPARALIEAVEEKCGCLPDDVAVIVIETSVDAVRRSIEG